MSLWPVNHGVAKKLQDVTFDRRNLMAIPGLTLVLVCLEELENLMTPSPPLKMPVYLLVSDLNLKVPTYPIEWIAFVLPSGSSSDILLNVVTKLVIKNLAVSIGVGYGPYLLLSDIFSLRKFNLFC